MISLGLGLGLNHAFMGSGFTGVLDTYPGAAAAYSLRALTSGWVAGDVVDVRRDSDSTEQDFTASQITNGQMLSFVNHDTTSLYNSARYFNGTSTVVDFGDVASLELDDFDVEVDGYKCSWLSYQ